MRGPLYGMQERIHTRFEPLTKRVHLPIQLHHTRLLRCWGEIDVGRRRGCERLSCEIKR